jgi:hypothetical protein
MSICNVDNLFHIVLYTVNRREIITVRGQSYVSHLPNIDPPSPSPPGECVPPAFFAGGGHTPGRREGWGINILEDERHRIALLQ